MGISDRLLVLAGVQEHGVQLQMVARVRGREDKKHKRRRSQVQEGKDIEAAKHGRACQWRTATSVRHRGGGTERKGGGFHWESEGVLTGVTSV